MTLDQLLAGAGVAAVVVAPEQLAASSRRSLDAGRLGAALQGPFSFSSRTTMPPSATSSTPKESTRVSRMRRSVSSPAGRSGAGRRGCPLADRPHARADAVAADLEREVDGAARARLREQTLDSQLESSISSNTKSTRSAIAPTIRRTAVDADGALEVVRSGWRSLARATVRASLRPARRSSRLGDRSAPHDAILAHQAGKLPEPQPA